MPPSVVNCLPIMPSLSSGPPIFCAVPPMAPSATQLSVPQSLFFQLPSPPCLLWFNSRVNCFPTEPCWSNRPGLSWPRWAFAGVWVSEAFPPVDLGPTWESWGRVEELILGCISLLFRAWVSEIEIVNLAFDV
jgi:hypothetical protein